MNDTVTSFVRTAAPIVAGYLVVQALKIGVDLEPGQVEGLVYPLAMGLWYAAARALEKKWPKLGFLLGVPREPTYT